MNKIWFLLVLLSFGSCNDNTPQTQQPKVDGAKVYRQYCTVCHGADGALGLNGAFNLATSALSADMALEVITHGRNAMAPYEDILSEAELAAVTDYILTLRQ